VVFSHKTGNVEREARAGCGCRSVLGSNYPGALGGSRKETAPAQVRTQITSVLMSGEKNTSKNAKLGGTFAFFFFASRRLRNRTFAADGWALGTPEKNKKNGYGSLFSANVSFTRLGTRPIMQLINII